MVRYRLGSQFREGKRKLGSRMIGDVRNEILGTRTSMLCKYETGKV